MRQSSHSRMQSRASRGGSMLGRSVVSTQCYSSVPASPEMCCKLSRLSFSNSEKKQSSPDKNNGLNNGNGSLRPSSVSSPSCSPSPSKMNHVNSVVKIKNSDSGTWTEIKLNNDTSPTSNENKCLFEMKPQKNVRISPNSPPTTIKNGIKGEHQL